jgi:hypothetical protein
VAASVLESILANLVTTGVGITTVNGYDFTVDSAQRFDIERNSLVNLRTLIVSSIDQDKLVETTRTIEWGANVQIVFHVVHDRAADSRSTDAVLTEARANLWKAFMVDRRRGGYAVDTSIENMTDFDLVTDDGRDTGVLLSLRIRYRHSATDPAVVV